jgi:SAM-dependent methyltransferase
MNIDNQQEYWNSVAGLKTFTHPLNAPLVEKLLPKNSCIIDFGCGYGRIVQQLTALGYENVIGYDSSVELIARGKVEGISCIFQLDDYSSIPLADNSVDCILLFAVLTCIPSNAGQKALVQMLYKKLKKGGFIYISDYYLQEHSPEFNRYGYLNNDKDNYGVFDLPEGAIFRHHTKEWIASLTSAFTILSEQSIQVMTMNGHQANGFQLIGKK